MKVKLLSTISCAKELPPLISSNQMLSCCLGDALLGSLFAAVPDVLHFVLLQIPMFLVASWSSGSRANINCNASEESVNIR